jgi:hypothetical protein
VVVPGQARACERRGEGEGRGALSVSQILVLHLCCNSVQLAAEHAVEGWVRRGA